MPSLPDALNVMSLAGVQAASTARPDLRFKIIGLPAREELLFKSYVRLLDHRTLHKWTYSEDAASLIVIAEQLLHLKTNDQSNDRKQWLVVGWSDLNQHQHLSLPLKPNDIERELNLLGNLISSPKKQPANQPASALGFTTDISAIYRLLRWPPSHLMGSRDRNRLATLISGKPVSLFNLQQRSGLSLQICKDFIHEMQQLDILDIQVPSRKPALTPVSVHSPLQAGLLSRIRSRLSIFASKD